LSSDTILMSYNWGEKDYLFTPTIEFDLKCVYVIFSTSIRISYFAE